jgi:four helix bundle protein
LNAAKSFEDLHIFLEARRLTADIWKITRTRPFSADRVLVNQIRRAGRSIVSNIAEGFERGSRAEFGRFLKIAKGSCGEVRAQMQVALDQNYLSKQECEAFCSAAKRISAGLSNLVQYLKRPARKPTLPPDSA